MVYIAPPPNTLRIKRTKSRQKIYQGARARADISKKCFLRSDLDPDPHRNQFGSAALFWKMFWTRDVPLKLKKKPGCGRVGIDMDWQLWFEGDVYTLHMLNHVFICRYTFRHINLNNLNNRDLCNFLSKKKFWEWRLVFLNTALVLKLPRYHCLNTIAKDKTIFQPQQRKNYILICFFIVLAISCS